MLAKAILVVPLLEQRARTGSSWHSGLGAFNNRVSVPRLRAGLASLVERRRFLYAVATELAVVVVIVAVTAVLVNEAPAKDQLVRTTSVNAKTAIGPFDGAVEVTPGA